MSLRSSQIASTRIWQLVSCSVHVGEEIREVGDEEEKIQTELLKKSIPL